MSIFKYKTILITGGTGSYGQAMTKRLIELKAKKIIIYSLYELNINMLTIIVPLLKRMISLRLRMK